VVQEREGHAGGVAPYALDPDNAGRLWKVSEQLTQQVPPLPVYMLRYIRRL
jgi:hypothetical protein